MIRAELNAIFSNRKLLIPIIAVLFIPILYAGIFLWSYWDPYSHLEELPVAVINNDNGAVFEGQNLEIGKELVKEIKKSDDFKFDIVTSNRAYSDLKNQKYYMVVEIPKDFSKNATTLLDEHPEKLQLKYVTNEGFNYLSGQIGNTAMLKIQASLQEKVTKTYTEMIFDKIHEMSSGLEQASDGAGKLNNGAQKLSNGLETLSNGIIDLSNGADQIKDNLTILVEKSVEFKQGVLKANDGSVQLSTGASELNTGLQQLKHGHTQLLAGTKAAKDGTDQLAAGIRQLNNGLNTADLKLTDLIKGTEEAKAGLEEFNNKMSQLKNSSSDLANGAASLDVGITQFENQLTNQLNEAAEQQIQQLMPFLQKSMTPEQLSAFLQQMEQQQESMNKQIAGGFNLLKDGSSQLKAGTKTMSELMSSQVEPNVSKLNDGLLQINEGQKQLKDGIHKLTNGADDLSIGVSKLQAGENELLSGNTLFNSKLGEAEAGSSKLAVGANTLTSGFARLTDGSEKISDGTKKLANGSQQLAAGSNKLVEGTKELSSGSNKLVDVSSKLHIMLGEASTQTKSIHEDDENYDMMAAPIKVDNQGINKVPNYGTGFTPYFLSLGLFVGALIISIVFPLVEPVIKPKNGFSWFTSKLGILIGIGVIQAVIADTIMLLGLGLKVESIPLFMFTSIITSLTFMTLIQMLVSILGDPGRFIAILVLIFQLATSAGTFPLELIPKVLQPINALLPMTYSVSAFRAVISTGNWSFMWHNIFILISYAIGFALVSILFFNVLFKRKFAHPIEN